MKRPIIPHRRLAPFRCPGCGHRLDAIGLPGSGDFVPAPDKGDKSVCIQCAAMLVFDGEPLSLRELKREELRELPREEADELRSVVRIVRSIPKS